MRFDLALALGMTVEELGLRMSQREFAQWAAYVEVYGSLSPVRMYDRPAALVSHMLSAVNGGKSPLSDFMPWPKQETEIDPADLDAGLGAFFSAFTTPPDGK